MTDNVGERIAGLEAAFKGFRNEMLKDTEYIRNKLDAIADSLSQKVDKPYCQDRHEKLNGKVAELGKNNKHSELEKRVRTLEQKVPAVVQQIVLVLSTGVVMTIISYLINRAP